MIVIRHTRQVDKTLSLLKAQRLEALRSTPTSTPGYIASYTSAHELSLSSSPSWPLSSPPLFSFLAHLLGVVLHELVHLLHRGPPDRHRAPIGSRRDAVCPGSLTQATVTVTCPGNPTDGIISIMRGEGRERTARGEGSRGGRACQCSARGRDEVNQGVRSDQPRKRT